MHDPSSRRNSFQMEKEPANPDHHLSASFSWWSDSHNRPCQSPWLQSVLSDLDEKIQTIVNLIQDDGDSFTERAEMFYKRRPQLLKILQDLHESYRSLAEKYDHLRSPICSSSLKLLQTDHVCKLEDSDYEEAQSTPVSGESEIKNSKAEQEVDRNANGGVDRDGKIDDEEETWSGLRLTVSKLIEDNRKHQEELIRRNDEKREVIKQLRAQISRLMEENRALMNRLPSCKVDFGRSESNSYLNCIGKFHK